MATTLGAVLVQIGGSVAGLKKALAEGAQSVQGFQRDVGQAAQGAAGLYKDAQGRMRQANGQFATTAQQAAAAAGTLRGRLLTAKDAFEQLQRSTRGLRDGLRSAGEGLIQNVSVPLAALGTAAILAGGNLQQARLGLESVTGSSQEAARQLDRLREIARAPGLGFEQAIKASVNLQTLGFTAEQAERTIRNLGNAVALTGGTRDDFAEVTRQLTQIRSLGRVTAENLNVIVERSPAVASALQAAFGTASAEAIRGLNLPIEQFFERLQTGLETLPRAQSSILDAFGNLKDDLQTALAPLGETIATTLAPVFSRLVGFVTALSERFQALSPQGQRFVVFAIAAAGALGPLFIAISAVVAALPAIGAGFAAIGVTSLSAAAPLVALVSGLVALGVAVVDAYQESDKFRTAVNELWKAAQDLGGAFADLFTDIVNAGGAADGAGAAMEKAGGSAEGLTAAVRSLSGFLRDIRPVIDAVREVWNRLAYTVEVFNLVMLQSQRGMVVLRNLFVDSSAGLARFDADIAAATARLRGYTNQLEAVRGAAIGASLALNGPLGSKSTGTPDPGPRTPRVPTVDAQSDAAARRTPRLETVAQAVSRMRAEIAALNRDLGLTRNALGVAEGTAQALAQAIEQANRASDAERNTDLIRALGAELATTTARAAELRQQLAIGPIENLRRKPLAGLAESVKESVAALQTLPAVVAPAIESMSALGYAAYSALVEGVGQAVDGVASSIGNAVAGILTFEEGFRSLGDAARSFGSAILGTLRQVVGQIASAIARALILKGILAIFGGATGGVGGFLVSALGGGAAKAPSLGGVAQAVRPAPAYAMAFSQSGQATTALRGQVLTVEIPIAQIPQALRRALGNERTMGLSGTV